MIRTTQTMQALLAILCLCFAVGPAQGQEPEAGDFIQFQVETHTGHFRNPEPVPHVGFEVLPLGEGPFAAILHAGTTDAKGMATVSLAAEFGGDEHPNVIVRVKQGGKSQSHGKWKKGVPGDSLGGPVSQLAIRDGWTCYWRIEDPSGAVVDGDFGWKFTVQGPKGRPRNRGRDRFRDRQLGPGWVSADSTGSDPIDFWAWKLGVGSVVHLGKEPWDIGRDGGALVLQPASTLRGRLLGSGGRRISQTELFVRKAGTDWLPRTVFDPPRVEFGESLTEEGLGVGLCTTQRDGRFELAGLEPGDYELLIRTESKEGPQWTLVGAETASTETDNAVAHYEQPVVQVRLLASDGSPWSGKYKRHPNQAFLFGHERFTDLNQWPSTPQMIVREIAQGDPGGLYSWTHKAAHWIPPDIMFSTIRPGNTYGVQIIGGGFPGHVHHVVASAEGASHFIEVTELPSAVPGKLVVTPKHGESIIGKAQYDDVFALWVADFETGFPLISRGQFAAGPSEFTLPPGKYRLVLEGRPFVDTHHGTLLTPRQSGRAEQIVQVQSGVEQSIDLSMNSGGRILLTINGEAKAEDKEAIQRRFPDSDMAMPWFAPMYECPTVEIRAPRFLTELVQYSAKDHEGTSSYGHHLQDHWSFGKTEKSEVLPTGTYQLVATMAGGRSTSTQITVQEGKLLEVTLTIPGE